MALSRSSLGSAADSDTNATTGSFTPPDNSLLVVTAAARHNNDQATAIAITDSLGTLTWTRQTVKGSADSFISIEQHTAPVATGASMTVTASTADGVGIALGVISYTGQDASPIGTKLEAFVAGTSGGSGSATLGASPASTSEVVVGVGIVFPFGPVATPGAGWAELFDLQGGACGLQVQWRGSSTSTSVAWSELLGHQQNSVVALEIKEAAAAGARSFGVVMG